MDSNPLKMPFERHYDNNTTSRARPHREPWDHGWHQVVNQRCSDGNYALDLNALRSLSTGQAFHRTLSAAARLAPLVSRGGERRPTGSRAAGLAARSARIKEHLNLGKVG